MQDRFFRETSTTSVYYITNFDGKMHTARVWTERNLTLVLRISNQFSKNSNMDFPKFAIS